MLDPIFLKVGTSYALLIGMNAGLLSSNVAPRLVMTAGVAGALLGIGISLHNADTLGWSCLRAAVLAFVFAFGARFLAMQIKRVWLEACLDAREQKVLERQTKSQPTTTARS